ncbi:translocation/assembly module TamB domain-containing protein [Dechloromonas sp. H13]|uniref:translocation/assembly module TamB domain-containing protein n=1 Tax=Dechloromonas sp. H13 TaxID=2570193 RepID=UPI00129170AD|nr:translocation/assembly module TamB domain-containing protein [Dechloromonas sp. H13]
MKRLVVLLIALLLAAGAWFGLSESGLVALARLAGAASGGRLQIEAAGGRLLGPLSVARLGWREPGLAVDIEGLRLDWSPGALLDRRLVIHELAAARVRLDIASSDQASTPPASLRLPVAVDVEKVLISRLDYGDTLSAGNLRAVIASDGRSHRLRDFSGELGLAKIAGTAELGGDAPLPLNAELSIAGQLDEQPLRLTASAAGPLDRIVLAIAAKEGVRGSGQALLTPFARQPFAEARLELADVDPAAWLAGAPTARLQLQAELRPDEGRAGAVAGKFELRNALAGPLDRQRLPLETLSGRFAWADDGARLSALMARLPGTGRLSGEGHWQDGSLTLDLAAQALDAEKLASVLRSTRLNGPISATLGGARQQVAFRLADARFTLSAEASHADGKLSLARLELGAGDALLRASGELESGGDMNFSASGELLRFDPSRFARVPAAALNGTLAASGRLQPRPVVEAQFALRDSRLAGQPLGGRGELVIDWPRIPRADIQLTAGPNRLSARGAFGQPGDSLRVDIEAPELAPYGIDGSLAGQITLAGTAAQPSLAGQLATPRLGLPGIGRLKGASLAADLGSQPDSPLRLDLRVATVDGVDQPGLLRKLDVQVAGTRRQHSLKAGGEIAGNNVLTLAAAGGFADDLQHWRWSGRLDEARLVAGERFRSFALKEPAALVIGGDAWSLGPLLLAGDPWQLRLAAKAGGRQLHVEADVRGPRLGHITGQFDAGMRDAWTLDRQAAWQGFVRGDTPDLAWLAELLDERAQTGGRLNSELKLAGTPEHPLLSGLFRGEALALTVPESGMRLSGGVLDARLDDNLLRVGKLAFDSPLQPAPRPLQRAAGERLAELAGRPGQLEISGEMRVDRSNESAALELRLDRIGVYQLPDRWLTVSGDGRIAWQAGTLAVRGRVAVDAAYWQMAPMGAPRLSDDVVILAADGTAQPGGFRPSLDLELETDLGRHFMFSGLGLETRLAGSVRFTAKGRDLPRASGRIRTQGGRFEAFGQQLEIERGILTFQGLVDNPAIDARAVRRGLAVEPGVQISGTVQRPVVRLVSDPDLPDVEKLSWLVLGHGPEQGGAGAAGLLLSAAGSLFGNESGGIVRQIKQGFGIDEFSVRQGEIGDSGGRQMGSRVVGSTFDTTAGTGNQILSVGRRLSNNVLLSYDQSLGRAGSVVKLSMALSRQVSLIARAGTDNALDVLYTFVFGEPPSRRRERGERSAR